MPREHLFANAVKPPKPLKQEGSRRIARSFETALSRSVPDVQGATTQAREIETRSRALRIGNKKPANIFLRNGSFRPSFPLAGVRLRGSGVSPSERKMSCRFRVVNDEEGDFWTPYEHQFDW